MNISLQFLKYNLHNTPFKTACPAIYFENLSGMSLILILLQNDPLTPPSTNFCLGLKNTSPYL